MTARSRWIVGPSYDSLWFLGADSLDFLDLVFTPERRFGVQLRGELGFLSRLDLTSPQVMKGEHLTQAAVEKLLPKLPALQEIKSGKVTPAHLFSLITVETLWLLVEKKWAAEPAPGTERPHQSPAGSCIIYPHRL